MDGIIAMGAYDSTPTANVAELIELIGDPDELVTNARNAGSNLDEMSPVARAQLRVELDALATALNLGEDGVAYGQYTCVAADDTANLVNIDTGLANVDLDTIAVTITRAGSIVTDDAIITNPSAGIIRVADGAATYDVTAGDIITWFGIDPA